MELRPALPRGSEFSAEHLGSSLGSHQNVLKITDSYRKIHFAIAGAKNKQWETLVKRRRDLASCIRPSVHKSARIAVVLKIDFIL